MLSWRGPDHPAAGGAEHYTLQVLRALSARGHRVTWFCERASRPTADGISLVGGGPPPFLFLRGDRFLRRHAKQFDVVIDQINVCGFFTPWISPIPVLVLIHQRAAEMWAEHPYSAQRLFGPIGERLALAPYRHYPFVTVSRTTMEDLRRQGWDGPAFIAHNGVEVRPPRTKEAQPTLVFLGRLGAPGKRLDHAVRAHALLRQHIPSLQLWVIGRGRPPHERPEGVHFFVNISDAERDERLGRSWVLVATSIREGWGRMVLEAAACGTTSVVYGTPGLAEAAQAVGGITTQPLPEALVTAVRPLLLDPSKMQRCGQAAIRSAHAFRWERTADTWEQALATLVP